MSNLLEQGEKWLAGMLQKHASSEVRYQRSSVSSTLRATIGRSVFEIAEQLSSAVLRIESRDYLVAAEAFAATGLTIPQPGDRIHETQGSREYVYEVMAPGGEPCWRWADAYRQQLRIHTKLVASE